ncbi:hypothetical protein EU513_02400 [Yimella sp. RIT 621]|nr:hypothetical protein EU513_02400 [Yimella sp. RIT 621]
MDRGDAVGAAVKRAGAELVGTKMSIRVNDVPDGTIELRPMTEDRFERFIGRETLWLNVFGHNADARRLYEREGYAVNEEIVRIAVGSDG